MKDPQPAPDSSPEKEPPASNSAAPASPADAEYQFPSRKARRIAELTGMIPIVVPGKPLQAQPVRQPDASTAESEPLEGEASDADTSSPQALASDVVKDDVDAPQDAGAAETADQAAEESSDAVVEPDAEKEPDKAADPEPEAESEPEADPEPESGADTAADPEPEVEAVPDKASDADVDAEQDRPTKPTADADPETAVDPSGESIDESSLRAPVSAVAVTGIPAVPLPAGPVGALPDELGNKKPPRTPKAGRDLPAAIAVGVILLSLVIGSLLFFPLAFVVVATAFVVVGVWEVTRAIGTKGIKAPLTPVMIGSLAMPASAYFAGSEGLLFALVASAGATLLWRSLDPEPGALKSILAGIFSLMWIPFLLSFVFLMLRGERSPTLGLTLDFAHINPGVVQVVIMLLLVVANDTFGYLVGVLFGKHPMAPKISPKKSWEGFAGSLGGATLVAIPATVFLLDEHWWVGFALAIGMVFAGTGGDFAESMIKRELGVKDMSNLLPGHGGVMDRLDSILFAAPVAYATFSVLGQI
ncbi:phosphatidate cytidylyltransferase [Arthrobacter sp. GMC3]|uniref:phosphatidate cytidylyltransferase n=1 Tax=Arthrobacter sp. GMC3 TaxID=2058894 RepID=UPI002795D570|nr:phosphatidate cytidylyltransferase [Arthrobacter sp. GMC3]